MTESEILTPRSYGVNPSGVVAPGLEWVPPLRRGPVGATIRTA